MNQADLIPWAIHRVLRQSNSEDHMVLLPAKEKKPAHVLQQTVTDEETDAGLHCKKVFAHKPYANLESPDIRQFAIDDPRGFLAQYPDGAILDEIQRAPDLVSYLQPMVDEDQREGLFILTGSQQFEVSNTINQSLAGRTAVSIVPFKHLNDLFRLVCVERLADK